METSTKNNETGRTEKIMHQLIYCEKKKTMDIIMNRKRLDATYHNRLKTLKLGTDGMIQRWNKGTEKQ